MKKAAVILGAGASYDVSNGSYASPDQWRPPLTSELFGDRAGDHFEQLMRRYPRADVLFQELYPLAATETLNLEQKLREYAGHSNAIVREAFKQIPPYLRDVLATCTDHYQGNSGCYTQLILGLLAHTNHDVAFIVMNYDDLLERALNRFDYNLYHYRALGDYILDDRPAKVFKLHGSVNWVAQMGVQPEGSWYSVLERLDLTQSLGQVEVRSGITNIATDIGNKLFYPVLTLPLANKTEGDLVAPRRHIEVLEAFLAECKKFLIIGTSGQDSDLIDILSRTVQVPDLLQFVSGSDVDTVASRFFEAIPPFQGAVRTELADRGLRDFLSVERGLNRFLRA